MDIHELYEKVKNMDPSKREKILDVLYSKCIDAAIEHGYIPSQYIDECLAGFVINRMVVIAGLEAYCESSKMDCGEAIERELRALESVITRYDRTVDIIDKVIESTQKEI